MATAVGSHFCIFTAEFACLCRGFPQPGSDVDQKWVQTQSGEVGTIEVTEEAKEGIGTGTGITDDSQKESAKTEETLPDKPIYREVRRNGITYIEKVGKETLQKESKEQEAQVSSWQPVCNSRRKSPKPKTASAWPQFPYAMMEQALLTNTISLPIQLRDIESDGDESNL